MGGGEFNFTYCMSVSVTCSRGCMSNKQIGKCVCVCAWERWRERQIVPDRQTKQGEIQTARQSWQDWGNRCVHVCLCQKTCYGPWSSIGWPQLSWSHWRRFHRRSVQFYSATLPGPMGAPASALHTQIHTTHAHSQFYIGKISQIHTFTQRSTQHSYETIRTDRHTQTCLT